MPVVRKFTHKPLEVEALMYDGNNQEEILKFSKGHAAWFPGLRQLRVGVVVASKARPTVVEVQMLAGEMLVRKPNGDVFVASVHDIQDGFDEAIE